MVEQTAAEIRRSILSGALAPGQELSLRELAGMLNVSFIPVREALRSLEAEGLLVTRPGRSAMVTELDLDDLRAIYRLRHELEPGIAARSCALLTEHDMEALTARAVELGAADSGIDEIYEAHHEFHFALLAPAATTWDKRILTILWRAAERYVRIGFGRLDDAPHEHWRREYTHLELVEAFRTRDEVTVRAAVHAHLEHNKNTALRALDPAPVSRATEA
ncbi:GntR family transcriptional regulator [Nocardia fusca]|uniref:GntR family transcriptional regulator n=1 Tax=Nocardia fusca TaxID=941183 RepID=UPI0037C9237C